LYFYKEEGKVEEEEEWMALPYTLYSFGKLGRLQHG
jgi:hypothetical protein